MTQLETNSLSKVGLSDLGLYERYSIHLVVFSGVPIHSCYGATEFGVVNEIEDDLTDWGYVRFSSRVDAQFIPQHDDDDTYELIFVVSSYVTFKQGLCTETWREQATEDHKPFVLNSELNRKPTYRTKDLVVRHPSRPDLWKLCGYIYTHLLAKFETDSDRVILLAWADSMTKSYC